MAMSQSVYKTAALNYLKANLKPKFQNLAADQNLQNLDFDTIWGIILDGISLIVPHIQNNAVATGADPQGGSVISTIT